MMGILQPVWIIWGATFLVGLVVVLLVRAVTIRCGLVDRPDPTRKLHRGAISLGGGIAVLITSALVLTGLFRFLDAGAGESPAAWLGWAADPSRLWGPRGTVLSVAALLITMLGVIDDRYPLTGTTKLLFQIAISALVGSFWHPAGNIELFGHVIRIGAFSGPLLMFWLLATINAVNLMDGADGVAGSFSAVAALGIAVVALINGNEMVVVMATILSAALAAFLCFNRPPATIFLGDAGSMLVGLLLGGLAILSVSESGATQAILVPVALLGVPLFDSSVAIVRRWLTGRSIYTADRAHLHHFVAEGLSRRGRSPLWVLAVFGGLSAITSLGAILGARLDSDWPPIVAMALVIAGLVGRRIFGHAEARLLASQAWRMGSGTWRRVRRGEPQIHVTGVSLQGERQWELIWDPLVEFAEKNGLWRLRLDLNMPWLHEGYHGTWTWGPVPEASNQWTLRLPVYCGDRVVGRLDVGGTAEPTQQLKSLDAFAYLVTELQPEIDQLVCAYQAVDGENEPPAQGGMKLIG
ncbi:MAG: undecaprenyl/decaprenyl-phosphate alpha-N-acetylglucosaminyl 1-phosphate transferase [Planctomycetaceae bacterium]|nr:MAG: undecaprenyl/decaprenyl-phosphate alpha-N-acetylglucosaminyl 1-phosphate transferase [Planctomycetaceae bacterium]